MAPSCTSGIFVTALLDRPTSENSAMSTPPGPLPRKAVTAQTKLNEHKIVLNSSCDNYKWLHVLAKLTVQY